MFSVKEKQKLSRKIEELIRELNHPEMDNSNIRFKIHIDGMDKLSYADITDNKTAAENNIRIKTMEIVNILKDDPDPKVRAELARSLGIMAVRAIEENKVNEK